MKKWVPLFCLFNIIKSMKKEIAIEFKNITKTFLDGKIIANKDVSFKIQKGTVHAIAGENGAGKSTLMSMLFGIYHPTKGEIFVNGNKTKYASAQSAMNDGIGMVHQHFQLVDKFTVAQNVALGKETSKFGFVSYKEISKKINDLCKKYKFNIKASDKIYSLSVGQEQKVEILKLLYTDSEILIFDEPTAMLTPEEIDEFISIVLDLKEKGKTIIIITHKLDEIKKMADEVTVLRKGEYVGTKAIKDITPAVLSKMMVGHVVEQPELPKVKPGEEIVSLENISVKQRGIYKLKDVSLSVKEGEIVAIAGVEGNGQKQLAEAISGLNKKFEGNIQLLVNNKKQLINKKSIKYRSLNGINHIPEDRHKYGMILDMTISENMMIRKYRERPYSFFGLLNNKKMKQDALSQLQKFDVRGIDRGNAPARGLSGGNQQKAVVARELSDKNSKFIIVFQATRGLDVGAIEYIHKQIIEARSNGKAVLLISYDINEIMTLADRVLVLNSGKVTGELTRKQMTKDKIGQLMSAKGK